MIIYATEMFFQEPTTPEILIEGVAAWLQSKRMRRTLDVDDLRITRSRERIGSQDIETYVDDEDGQIYHWAMRFSHGDPDVPGRRWHVEVGLAHEQGKLRASVLLRTDETSSYVTESPLPSRPRVVNDLLNHSSPEKQTPGLVVYTLDEQQLLPLRDSIESRRRTYPIIMVSPAPDGSYSIAPHKLLSHVATLADVCVIPPDLPFAIRDRILGPTYNAWEGVVKIIWPFFRTDPAWTKARTQWFTPDDFTSLDNEKHNREIAILAAITHRTNLPISQRHISPERVREAALRREIAHRPHQQKAAEDAYIELLAGLERNKQQVDDDMIALSVEKEDLEEQLRKANATIQSLKQQIERLEQGRTTSISLPNDEFRQAIYRLHQTKLTLNDGLCILKQIFPERIVILPSAWKSAAEAARFERTPQAFDLLWKLVTDYWEMLVAGQGNHAARQIFGDDFAATESETVQHNTRARRLRTFSYNGQEIEMLMHLRLGRKESIAQTWRTHFTWDAERKIIVIGHCGKHLDHD